MRWGSVVAAVASVVVLAAPASAHGADACGHEAKHARLPFLSQSPPPAHFVNGLSVLRRPATDADALPADVAQNLAFDSEYRVISLPSIRLLRRTSGGDAFYLVVTKTRATPLPPADCLRQFPRGVRRTIRRHRAREVRLPWVLCVIHVPPASGLFPPFAPTVCDARLVSDLRGVAQFQDTSLGRGVDVSLTATAQLPEAKAARSRATAFVYALVPDGVASVLLGFRDGSKLELPVADNFVLGRRNVRWERRLRTIDWRDASGAVVATFRSRRR